MILTCCLILTRVFTRMCTSNVYESCSGTPDTSEVYLQYSFFENVTQPDLALAINDSLRNFAEHQCYRFVRYIQGVDTRETLTSSLSFSSMVLGDGVPRERMLGQGTVLLKAIFELNF